MVTLLLKRQLNGFALADQASVDIAKQFKIGEIYRAQLVKPRSRKALSRYWVLCEMILDNTEMFRSKKQVSDYLKIRIGHSTSIIAKSSGEIFMIPDSINFDALDEVEFADVWRRVCEVVCQDILPGITPLEVENEIAKIVGIAA